LTTKLNVRFLPRDALVHSAVLRLHVVRPSVTLVDQDHKGLKSWKLIARTISPTPLLFVAQKPSTYSQGNMRKFFMMFSLEMETIRVEFRVLAYRVV